MHWISSGLPVHAIKYSMLNQAKMSIQKSNKATHQNSSKIAASEQFLRQTNNFILFKLLSWPIYQADDKWKFQSVKLFLKKLSLNLDQFSEELKTNFLWLKLLVADLSIIHGLFKKGKEQYGTRHFLKANYSGEESKQTPLACELFEMFL